jgi:large subunit ribosomal protein L15
LQTAIDTGKLDAKVLIDADVLKDAGVVRQIHDGVRLLAKGELNHKVNIELSGISEAAKVAVEKLGGSVNILA